MAMFGVVIVLLGTLFGLPEVRARLELTDLVRQGNLQSILLAGVFLSTIVCGPLIDRFGHKPVLASSGALVTAALVGFAVARSYDFAVAAGLLLGFGGGGLNISTNALVSDLYTEERGAKLNQLGLFFGVGGLVMPFLAAAVSARFSIPQILGFVAGLAAVCTLLYFVLRFPAAAEGHGFSLRGAARVARYPGVLLFALLLFFQSGNEACLSGWTSTWASGLGAPPRAATWILALFLACMMLGRLLAAPILGRIGKAQLVLASAAGAAVGSAIVLLADLKMLVAGVAIIGLSYAGIYPTVLAMAGDRYQRFSGTVFGLLFSIALLGGIAAPWSLGHLSQALGVRYGVVVPLVGAVMICGIMAVIMRRVGTAAIEGKQEK